MMLMAGPNTARKFLDGTFSKVDTVFFKGKKDLTHRVFVSVGGARVVGSILVQGGSATFINSVKFMRFHSTFKASS